MRATLRFLGFLGTQWLVWTGLGMVAGACVALAVQGDEADFNAAGVITLSAVGIGFIAGGSFLGMLLYRLTSGVFAIVYAALAFATGLVLIPVAAALRQFEPLDWDPERAAGAALLGAALALGLGAGLALLGWRWTGTSGDGQTPAGDRSRLRQTLRGIAIAWGTLLAHVGLALTLSALIGGDNLTGLSERATSTGFGVLLLLAGGLLVYHGVSAFMGGATTPVRWPPDWLAGGLWLAAVGMGWLLLRDGGDQGVAFPLVHTVAALGGGVLLIGLVLPDHAGRDARLPAWRSLALSFAWGAACATTLAVFLELVADSLISIGVLAGADAFQGVSTSEEFGEVVGEADRYLSEGQLLFAAFALFSISAPLCEEPAKALGVRLLRPGATTRAMVFVLGVAAGVGFGTLEAILYGAAVLNETPGEWWLLMLLRGGAASMHAVATGLFALAIFDLKERRIGRALALIAASLAMHAAWNGMSVLAISDSLPIIRDLSDQAVEDVLSTVLGIWSLLNLAILILLARTLRREEPAREMATVPAVPAAGPAWAIDLLPPPSARSDTHRPPPVESELTTWRRPPPPTPP